MDCAAMDLGLVEAVGVCNYSTAQLKQFHSLMLARDTPIASNQVLIITLLCPLHHPVFIMQNERICYFACLVAPS